MPVRINTTRKNPNRPISAKIRKKKKQQCNLPEIRCYIHFDKFKHISDFRFYLQIS